MAHANARLPPAGRLILCQRIAAGRPAGLVDRPSTAHRHPHQVPATAEAEIVRLRRQHKLGPARIAHGSARPASTVHRVLVRRGLNRLAAMDRPTGRRGYAAARPALVAATWQPSAIASCWHRTTTQRTTT